MGVRDSHRMRCNGHVGRTESARCGADAPAGEPRHHRHGARRAALEPCARGAATALGWQAYAAGTIRWCSGCSAWPSSSRRCPGAARRARDRPPRPPRRRRAGWLSQPRSPWPWRWTLRRATPAVWPLYVLASAGGSGTPSSAPRSARCSRPAWRAPTWPGRRAGHIGRTGGDGRRPGLGGHHPVDRRAGALPVRGGVRRGDGGRREAPWQRK